MPKHLSLEDAMKIAQSDVGKSLYSLLQNSDPNGLNTALSQAKSGDIQQLKETVMQLMSSPDARAILQKLQEDQ